MWFIVVSLIHFNGAMGAVLSKVVNKPDMPAAENVAGRKKSERSLALRNANIKDPPFSPQPPPTDVELERKPKVLILEPNENKVQESVPCLEDQKKQRTKTEILKARENSTDDFEEFESQILSFPNDDDEESLLKERKFVAAWKAALAFPQSKIINVSARIPVAATSFCTTDITRWTKCRRHCMLCATRSGKEKILDDLVHRDSLYRFLLEHDRTEPMKSIIVLKQDFRRHRMTEIVDHLSATHDKLAAAKAEAIRKKQKEKDDDLTITVRVPVHMPVHINFVPEKPEHVFPKIKDDPTKPPPGHDHRKSHSDSSLLKHRKDEKKAKFLNFKFKSLEW